MQAMLLAAGRGSRLQPLTDTLPKPLVTVGNEPLLGRHIRQLKATNIDHIMINAFYRSSQILDYVTSFADPSIECIEERQLLGTGGALSNVINRLEDRFLLISADMWTTFPLELLMQTIQSTIVLQANSQNPDYYFSSASQLYTTSKEKALPVSYGGLAILSRDAIESFCLKQPTCWSIGALFTYLINRNNLDGILYDGHLINVGTFEELAKARSIAADEK